eukprot:CAMPEP_0173438836 /NCGR_PEP_ID=MMETSP1357-20121228/20628_1 /TAXON_ID=77926 /ORGANISM="Hemiselmis rufescens, Strain PCC563" /LENGTH=168 /DNA_ID=CAMNT_0014404157 /DNA_START=43 /DNA_END=549 /DNA_ORIENTATION=-
MAGWDAVKALNELEVGEKRPLEGTAYILSRGTKGPNSDDQYACTCQGWLIQKGQFEGAGNIRTCKHLKQFRGEDAEVCRLNAQYQELHMKKFGTPWQGKILSAEEKKEQAKAAAKAKRDAEKARKEAYKRDKENAEEAKEKPATAAEKVEKKATAPKKKIAKAAKAGK